MRSFTTGHVAAAAALFVATAMPLSAHAGAPVWISLGNEAYQLLRGISPTTVSASEYQLPVQVPVGKTAALRDTTETVHVVRVDEDLLPQLSDAVHTSLRHCGGYMVHASLGAARRAVEEERSHALRARGQAALAAKYPIDNQATVTPLLAQVQDSNILSTIQTLSDYQNRYYTTTHGVAASNGIKTLWEGLAAGRTDVSVSQFTHPSWPQKSVILTIQGTATPNQILVLGGHMDSILSGGTNETSRAPGADDDASGIASLTEALRVMLASGYKPRRTIQFMAYAAEEVGLRGSAAIAADYVAKGKKVKGVMQLDMTNYKGSAQDIFIYTDYTNAKQNDFLARLVSTYMPTLKVGYSACGYGCSDHASWTARGYVASFPFESSFNAHDPYIHTINDTLANTGNQAAHAAKFARLALAYAVELGSD